MRTKTLPVVAGLTALLMAGSAIGFTFAQDKAVPAAPLASATAVPSLAPVVGVVLPSVVSIAVKGVMQPTADQQTDNPAFQQNGAPDGTAGKEVRGEGSGVIVDAAKGLVITNNHVVSFASQIEVTLADGRTVPGKVLGTDPGMDVALVQIPADNLKAINIAPQQNLRVGDYVLAVGNPFGLGETVTSGIVSALGRTDLGIEGYENFIQTDASINPGNSGGALVDLNGNLVGMNTAIVGPNGGSVGVGFAIPVQMISQVVAQIEKYGNVERGQLGVQIQNLTPDLVAAMGLPNGQAGAVITEVNPNTPAATAGLNAGDVVTGLNGQPVASSADLRTHVGLMRAGDKVDLKLLRGGKTIDASLVLTKAVAA